jgi:Ca2+-transporting ATPase
MEWHSIDKKEVMNILKSDENGISGKEASERLKKYGKNELKQVSRFNSLKIFLYQFKSIFIIILVIAALFSLSIKHYIDFAVISIIVLLNSCIGFFQQYKAEKIIFEMKQLLVPKVKVLRNNILSEIPSSEIVPGDILMVSEGEKIMADCRIIHSNDMEANEAVLTGESFPQQKNSVSLKIDAELANRENMLFMGTSVAKGNAKAIVVSTGMNTEFGKIAKLVQKNEIQKTPLERKLDSFSKNIAIIVIILSIITIAIGFFRGENLYSMFLTGVALAISVIPEGIPAVIAITLAFAIKRMEKQNALIRKLPAAETLGRTTVICTDKTGTLTEEEMTVISAYCDNKQFKIEDTRFFDETKEVHPLKVPGLKQMLRIGILCNNARIEEENVFGDPTEKALIISAEKAYLDKKKETEKETRIIEYSFSSKRKLMSIVRKNDRLISYVKGAPDVLLRHCDKELIRGRIVKLTTKRKLELFSVYEEMASNALRVLAFAYREVPKKFNQEIAENSLIFVGFQGMLDPPRKEVKQAIRDCIDAGIKIKMVTGDSLLTAVAVSGMIGLDGKSIEAKYLENLSEAEFDRCVMEKTVFARITPELKLRIIKSLKKQKEVVAVTGDGVNDALALKEADIGIAMGIRGTDVARDVSDIILLNDNFSSIVGAIREGRRVYDNMRKSIKFHLAANVHELLLVMIALIMALPLPLLPLAILWMNLITDSLPSLALSVEKEEEDIMKRKPTNPKESILKGILGFIIIAGLISFVSSLTMFMLFYQNDLEKARTIALTTSVFCEMFLVFTCRSDKSIFKIGPFSNKFLLYSVIAAVALQMIAIYTPLAAIFGFKALSLLEMVMVTAAASLGFIFFEAIKATKNKRANGLNRINKEY